MDLNEDEMAVKAANRRKQPKKKKKMIVADGTSTKPTAPSTEPPLVREQEPFDIGFSVLHLISAMLGRQSPDHQSSIYTEL